MTCLTACKYELYSRQFRIIVFSILFRNSRFVACIRVGSRIKFESHHAVLFECVFPRSSVCEVSAMSEQLNVVTATQPTDRTVCYKRVMIFFSLFIQLSVHDQLSVSRATDLTQAQAQLEELKSSQRKVKDEVGQLYHDKGLLVEHVAELQRQVKQRVALKFVSSHRLRRTSVWPPLSESASMRSVVWKT